MSGNFPAPSFRIARRTFLGTGRAFGCGFVAGNAGSAIAGDGAGVVGTGANLSTLMLVHPCARRSQAAHRMCILVFCIGCLMEFPRRRREPVATADSRDAARWRGGAEARPLCAAKFRG